MLKSTTRLVAIPLLVAGCTTAVAVASYQAQNGQNGNPPHGDMTKKALFPGGTPLLPGPMMGPAPGAMGAMGAMAVDPEQKRIAQEEREREQAREQRLETIARGVMLQKKDPNPLSQAVWKMLETPVAMPFQNETSLDDVLKYIREAIAGPKGSKAPGIPIYVNPKGLAEAEKSLQSTITINLEGIPLKTTLRLVLEQIDLGYCVRDGILIITSAEGVADEIDDALAEIEAEEAESSPRPGSPEPSPARKAD